jgi:hypothetical protein
LLFLKIANATFRIVAPENLNNLLFLKIANVTVQIVAPETATIRSEKNRLAIFKNSKRNGSDCCPTKKITYGLLQPEVSMKITIGLLQPEVHTKITIGLLTK